MRVLKKGKTSTRVIHFYSKKNGCHIPCEGRLEKANCLLLESDETVEKYLGQPIKLELENFSYTPDCLIKYRYGLYELREVKPAGKAKSPELMEKFEIIRRFCEQLGVIFRVVTEHDLSKQPDFFNREFLYRSALMPFVKADIHAALEALKVLKPNDYPLSHIRATLLHSELNPLLAERLIFDGFLSFNTNFKISNRTLIQTGGY